MGTFFVFLGTLLLSQFVALLAALQLADHFHATEAFIVVMMAIMVFAVVAIAVFAVTYTFARNARLFAWVAVGLVVAVTALVVGPSAIDIEARRLTNPFGLGAANNALTIELWVPALITVLIQWGLVRRRFLHVRGEDDLTGWPWFTTAVAGLAMLNPVGLNTLAGLLAPERIGRLADLWRSGAGIAAAVVILMLAVECTVRGRLLRRRQAAVL